MLRIFSPGTRQRVSGLLDQVAEYIHSRIPHWHKAEGQLRPWLLWYFCNGLLSAQFCPVSSAVKSVVVARYLLSPQQYQKTYFHAPGGPICFVEMAAAEESAALWAAIDSVLAKHGLPELIMFQRGKRNERPRLYRWDKFARILEKAHGRT